MPDAPRLYRQGTKVANRHATMHSVLLVSAPSPAVLQKKLKNSSKLSGKYSWRMLQFTFVVKKKKNRKKSKGFK